MHRSYSTSAETASGLSTVVHADQEVAATTAIQTIRAQGDTFQTIKDYLTIIKSQMDDLSLQFHNTSEHVQALTASLQEHTHCLHPVPQLVKESSNATASSATIVEDGNNPITPQATSELDEMKRKIKENSQSIDDLIALYKSLAAKVESTVRADNHEDDKEEDDLAQDLNGEHQRAMNSGQNGNNSTTNTGYKSVASLADKGKKKSQEYGQRENGVLKKEEVGVLAEIKYTTDQVDVFQEDNAEAYIDLAPQSPTMTTIFPKWSLCHLFDRVANLYPQPSQESVKILVRQYKFPNKLPDTLEEVWKLWFLSEDDRPSIWSLEALIDNWRLHSSSSQAGNYHRQKSVIYEVLDRLLDIEQGHTAANEHTLQGDVADARAQIEIQIESSRTFYKYAAAVYKKDCQRRRPAP
ncbi:hypothetical protein EC991_004610 [Linnemannia zychae]|nr:hypothetical protein EC991_004610 [Linnemannia zychae]